MLVSGNDAAVALAEFISGDISNFAILMNNKASTLGLNSSHFTTPHGLDSDEHYTTALELAKIADYALKNELFYNIVNTKSYTITINSHSKTLNNTNELLGYLDGVYGVKTGFTNGANRCLVTSCKRNNFDIICIVLGCDTKKQRTLDSINLINYTFNNFTQINIKSIILDNFEKWKKENLSAFKINKASSSNFDLYLDESTIPSNIIVVENTKKEKISTPIQYTNHFDSPLYKDTIIGKMNINIDNETIFDINILTANTIKRKNVFYYMFFIAKNYYTFLKFNY